MYSILSIKCIFCNKSHKYNINIEKGIVLYDSTQIIHFKEPKKVKYTRYFICPTTNKRFKATFTLNEYPSEKISSVTVEEEALE